MKITVELPPAPDERWAIDPATLTGRKMIFGVDSGFGVGATVTDAAIGLNGALRLELETEGSLDAMLTDLAGLL